MLYKKTYLLIVALILLLRCVVAQNFSSSEESIVRKAERYFKRDSFAAAMPLFSQMLSLHPREPVYSYKFGVCLLMADRRDSKLPLKYLEYALGKEGVSNEIHYYLGMAYHQNYRFNEAIKEFNIYKQNVREGEVRKNDIDRKIEMCKNGMNLLNNINDLYVLERKTVNKKDFFRSYNFREFGGKFLAKLDNFKTRQDIKMNDNSFVFYSEKNKVIYFSGYGEDGNNRDIYRSFKDKFGEWSKPERLSSTINTEYDEDYPYILPDGKTLYFCSKGHNSMGGYDIFKSVYDRKLNAWSNPQNLDFAINTPFDDILFVSDSVQQYAYFSSTRNTAEGMLSVYKVRIDKRIKAPEAESKVKDELAFTIQDSTYLNYLMFKENLEVNATEEMFPKKEPVVIAEKKAEVKEKKKPEVKPEQDSLQYEDPLVYVGNQLKTNEEEEEKYKAKMESANRIAEDKNDEARNLNLEADSIITYTNHYTDPITKQQEINKANILKKKAQQLEREGRMAKRLSKKYEEKYVSNQKEANKAAEYIQQIKKVQTKGNSDSALALMSDYINTQKTDATENNEEIVSDDNVSTDIKEIKEIESKQAKLENDIKGLNEEAEDYKNQAKNTRDSKLKNTYLSEAKERDSIISVKRKMTETLAAKHEQLTAKADSIATMQEIENSVMAQMETVADNKVEAGEDQIAKNEEKPAVKEEQKKFKEESVKVADEKVEVAKEETKPEEQQAADNNKIAEQKLTAEKEKQKANVETARESLKKEIQKTEAIADNAVKIAIDKNRLAKIKEKKADSIYSRAGRIRNKQLKQQEQTKAAKLDEEAEELKYEAVASYKLSEKIQDEIKSKKELDIELLTSIDKIEQAKDENELRQNDDIIKVNTNAAKKNIVVAELAIKEDPGIAQNKEKEAKLNIANAEKKEKELKPLKTRAENLKKQISGETNKKKAAKIQKELEQVQADIDVKEKELESYNNKAAELTAEAKKANTVSAFQDELINNLTANNNTDSTRVDNNAKEALHDEIATYEKQGIKKKERQEIAETAVEATKYDENKISSAAEDIAVKANNRVDKVQSNIAKVETYANELLETSKLKFKEAENKGRESKKLLDKAENSENASVKQDAANKSSELKRDSAILIQEAIVSKNVSILLTEKVKEQKQKLDSVYPYLKQVEDYAINNDVNNAEEAYETLTQKLDNKAFNVQSFQQNVASEISTTAYNKIRKSNTLISEAKKLEANAYKAGEEANKARNDEENAEDKKLKTELHEKYLIKQKVADSVSEAVKEKYREGNQLKIEATALKTQIEYAVNLIKKSSLPVAKADDIAKEKARTNIKTEIKKDDNAIQIADNKNKQAEIKGKAEKKKETVKDINKTEPVRKDSAINKTETQLIAKSKQDSVKDAKKAETKAREEKDAIAANQIKEYTKLNAENQIKYMSVKNESEQLKEKLDSNAIKDTAVNVYNYEADYYFKQAQITRNKADSVKNLTAKSKLLKDANNYELIAIEKQNNALTIYKAEKSRQASEKISQSIADEHAKADSTVQIAINKQAEEVKPQVVEDKGKTAIEVKVEKKENAIEKTKLKPEEKKIEVEQKSEIEITKQSEESKKEQLAVNTEKKTDSLKQQNEVKPQVLEEKVKTAVMITGQSEELKKEQSAINNETKADSIKQQNEVKPQMVEDKGKTAIEVKVEKKENAIEKTELKPEEKKIEIEPKSEIEINRQSEEQKKEQSAINTEKKTDSIKQQNEVKPQVVEDKGKTAIEVKVEKKENTTEKTELKPEEKKIELEPKSDIEITRQSEEPKKEQSAIDNNIKVDSIKQQNEVKPQVVEDKGKRTVEVKVEKKEKEAEKPEVKEIKVEPQTKVDISKTSEEKLFKKQEVTITTEPETKVEVKTEVKPEPVLAGKTIETVKGLFYTVQVGVFAKPRTEEQMKNIAPVFFDKMANGNFRYLTGIFDKKEDATDAKNKVIESGIKDAFVVIYNNGKRITTADLQKLTADNQVSYADALPFRVGEENLITSNEIVFKVQIGAYKKETDVRAKNAYLKSSNVKIDRIKNENGLLIYFAGNFKDFESASELKTIIVKSGIKDAFIVAIKNNKKIPVVQAREMVKKIIKN